MTNSIIPSNAELNAQNPYTLLIHKDIPQDLFQVIFKNFTLHELLTIKKVCKTFYQYSTQLEILQPALSTFLRNIRLLNRCHLTPNEQFCLLYKKFNEANKKKDNIQFQRWKQFALPGGEIDQEYARYVRQCQACGLLPIPLDDLYEMDSDTISERIDTKYSDDDIESIEKYLFDCFSCIAELSEYTKDNKRKSSLLEQRDQAYANYVKQAESCGFLPLSLSDLERDLSSQNSIDMENFSENVKLLGEHLINCMSYIATTPELIEENFAAFTDQGEFEKLIRSSKPPSLPSQLVLMALTILSPLPLYSWLSSLATV